MLAALSHPRRHHLPCLAALIAGSLPQVGNAQSSPASPYPAIKLSKVERGASILTALGNRLPEVAKFHGITDKELGKLCLRERDLRADKSGRLFYACAAPVVANAPTATNGGTAALLTYPSNQTFLLHSKPGMTRVLYLDFNGHSTTGTEWNKSFTTNSTITTPAYDTDSVPATFSTSELANIQEIWRRVSEDYAPWDVDVTTEEPPLESLRKTTSTDTAYGIRMVIGGSSNDWFGGGAGGVAYLGSYSWNTDTPAFIFPVDLAKGYPKYVAEAVSHEAGHTLGLSHDGATDGTEYSAGANGWAPIMGVGYSAALTQFSRGEYTGANNTQDDLALINGHIPPSPDLVGNDILTATPLTGTSVSVTGIVESRTDADLFKINSGAGTLNFTATPAAPDSNLDIQLALYNGAGSLITSSNPSGLAATLSTSVSAGTYYIAVEGVGFGAPATNYSDYASIGQFSLTGTVPATSGKPPVAVVTQSTPTSGLAPLTVNFSSAGSSDPEGSALTYDWDFGDGSRSTAPNPQHVYTTPGNFIASLVVFDATGLSASASVTIAVKDLASIVYVSSLTITKSATTRGTSAKVVVTVKDAKGNLKPSATVKGTWSGLTTGTVSAITNTSGSATFTSAVTKSAGTFTFSVTGITLTGATYDPARNLKTTVSIVK